MEQMRSSSTSASSANERFPAQRLEPLPTRPPSGLFSRLSHPLSRPPSGHVLMAAAALAVLSAAPVKAIADETGESAHQVIAIVETGLKLGSDTEVIDVICEALGPEISCEVKEAPENRMPSWQDIHGPNLVRTYAKKKDGNGNTVPGKLTLENWHGNIVSENTEMENPGIFIAETGVPFAEAHLIVFDDDKGNTVPAWILQPVIQNGIVEYIVEEMFDEKELLGGGGYTTDYYQGKMMGVSTLSEDNGKKHFVTIEKKDGIWQITEKNEMPEEYDPWDSLVLENYPGGKKIAIANGVLGVAIHEPGNMKEPFLTFHYPEYQEQIWKLELHPNGKFLIASGFAPGFFIIDIEDPSNHTYIFGTAGDSIGFDEKGFGQNFLSYVEIVQEKPLKVQITKYEPNTFDHTWNGSNENNGVPVLRTTTGIEQDKDKDGRTDFFDNCYTVPNPDQLDTDGDSIGDACEKEEPIEPEPEPPVEQGNPEPEKAPEPQPEESGKPAEEEPDPELVTAEEVTVAEETPDVIEPPKDVTEESPEVVQPKDTMEEGTEETDGKGDTQTPKDENTPEDTAAEDTDPLGMESDGNTDEEDQRTETAEEKDTSAGSPDAGNTDPVSGNDLAAPDAGRPGQKDVSENTPPSPAAGNDGGCTMRINKMGINEKGNPFIIFAVATTIGGLALAQRRRRQRRHRKRQN